MAKKDVNVKKIKEYILDYENNISEVIEHLEDYLESDEDYYYQLENEVIKSIFKALFVLFRHYECENKVRCDTLISFIEMKINENSFENSDLVKKEIEELSRKIKNLKNNQQKNIKRPFDRLLKIRDIINLNIVVGNDNKQLKRLEFLIFRERNIELIRKYLDDCKNILYKSKDNSYDMFSLIVEKYIYLNPNNLNDINYYFHVILLFLKSSNGASILKNKDRYLNIIYKSGVKCNNHVVRLIKLFTSKFEISLEEFAGDYNINFEFPKSILNEIYTFKTLRNERVNFTNQECITIDGKNDKCLDDALYMEKNADGTYTLYVHITDIPSFIPYSSLANEEARKRGESLYLCDTNVPMYPEYISNGTCSLLFNNNRNVISFIFKLDSDFNLLEDQFDIVKGKIRVIHNMSYEEADYRLMNLTNSKIDLMLMNLCLFSIKRRDSNKYKEFYRFYENLINFKSHHVSFKVNESNSANIVHESMILTNYSIAKYFKDLSLPYIFRMLSLPSDDFIENKIRGVDENNIFTESFLNDLRESYIKATYVSFPGFHKGLNLECYSHSTSPARRYADAMGQYIIHDLIFDNHLLDTDIYKWEYRVLEIVKYLNRRKEELELFQSQYNFFSCKKMLKKRKK